MEDDYLFRDKTHYYIPVIRGESPVDKYAYLGKLFKKKDTKGGNFRNGILLPKLFRPTVRKKCSSDREKLLKFEAEG